LWLVWLLHNDIILYFQNKKKKKKQENKIKKNEKIKQKE